MDTPSANIHNCILKTSLSLVSSLLLYGFEQATDEWGLGLAINPFARDKSVGQFQRALPPP